MEKKKEPTSIKKVQGETESEREEEGQVALVMVVGHPGKERDILDRGKMFVMSKAFDILLECLRVYFEIYIFEQENN